MDAYPAEERQDAINLLSVLSMVAPVMGPIVAGFVLERFSWPILFFMNVPLAMLAIWFALSMDIDQKAKSAPGRFSFTTIGLLFAALFCVQYVLQSGERLDWFDSAQIRWSLFGAVTFGGFLIAQQIRTGRPMIDLRLFSNRDFLIGNLMSFIAGSSNYAVAFIGPLFLQQVLGFSPLQTALLTIPATIGLFIGNRMQDYLMRRTSVYWIVAAGMILLAIALWYNGVYADFNDFTSITWLRIIQGIAFGVFIVPIGVFSFKTIKQNQIDAASGLFGVIRQESGMIGIALIATLLESSQNRFLQRLLLDIPRWPLLLHRGAASRDQIVAAVNQHAFVLGYQQVFAISAAIMCAAGLAVALYGVWDRLGHALFRNEPAGDLA
jgi:DHA2 family multidrug resistance protein